MPYWKREDQLRKTLDRYERLYPSLHMEVVVANDGGPSPSIPRYSFPVTVIDLPEKEDPKNPCIALNAAVSEAVGAILCITNPENYHPDPIFPKMMEELLSLGERGYVLAACWGNETKRWHCHSKKRGPGQDRIPDNSGLHFCSMMYRKFFHEVGGFDEDYRDGSGYEDNDFAWRVHRAGGVSRVRDDLIVHHPKSTTNWDRAGFSRNRQLFHSKWQKYWNQS